MGSFSLRGAHRLIYIYEGIGGGGGEIQNIVKKIVNQEMWVTASAYNVYNAVLIQVTMEILLACVR